MKSQRLFSAASAAAILSLLSATIGLSACSSSRSSDPSDLAAPGPAIVPAGIQGPELQAAATGAPGAIAAGKSEIVALNNGAEILVHNIGGTLFHEVEGTLSNEAFDSLSSSLAALPKAERNREIGKEISKVLKKLGKVRAMATSQLDEVAYFSFFLPYTPEVMASLKSLSFDQRLLLNPVTVDREALRQAKAHTPAAEGISEAALKRGSRDGTSAHSGLARVHALDFVKIAEADIGGGAKVNGSSVALGITDTGMTLAHPAFLSAADGPNKGRNRVEYLKDFTREGRIYFSPAAKFEAIAPAGGAEEDLLVSAEIILTPRVPELPAGDRLAPLKDLPVKVSPALKALLTQPGTGIRAGVLLEQSLVSEEDPVDLNANGKSDDRLLAFLVPGATPSQDALYIDFSGTFDFRGVKPLFDFNASRSTTEVFAETIGFHIQEDKLPKADGSGTIDVRSASIVGYDPGNHGTHVAGIAAGSKTIANDDAATLARGVAPEARILLDRVCSNNAGCGATGAMADLALNGAEVVNMSLGGLNAFNDGYGVQETLVNRLTSLKNTLFVISAGNSGPGHQTVGSPSTARLSLSVGATATQALLQRQYQYPGSAASSSENPDDDLMLFFSSRGPTAAGGFKPNVTAPGTELSAIQLNSAPGAAAGLAVYWGTSMAAPTATGAYALLLDGIKKYNAAHPDRRLTTDALILRTVLIETARAFDAKTFDPATGARTEGRYTWVDQGKGMVDLVAAWKKLHELRDAAVPSAVTLNGQPVELDYQVLVSTSSSGGSAYDGSRPTAANVPALGTGVYLDFNAADTLRQVAIARRLPESLAAGPDAGKLTRQLVTTQDEFVLKTVIHGSDVAWLKAGVLDELSSRDCATAEAANLTVLGRGAEVKASKEGEAFKGELVAQAAGSLNLCIDREAIATKLAPGDHGALVSAFRVVGGKVSPLASFTVPVYVTVPHRTLADGTGYETTQVVRSFDVSRNYVTIPAGTSVVKITLEVPAVKTVAGGRVAPGESCSGIELMALLGGNTVKPFKTRPEARISNCDASGAPVPSTPEGEAKRKLVFSTTEAKAGVWDLHVFGQYKYGRSQFRLRVDYVNAETSVSKIEGKLSALNGSLGFHVKDASVEVAPSADKSRLVLEGLRASSQAQVGKEKQVIVPGATGSELRQYPTGTRTVTIATGGSAGNDIDLAVLECEAGTTAVSDEACKPIGQSGGATDVESVTFKPKAEKLYAAVVAGYDIHDEGRFTSTETLILDEERGTLSVSGSGTEFQVTYAFGADLVAASKILGSELFASGKYAAVGALSIRSADRTLLASVPVQVTKE